ncbi:bifunctional 3,4-dihydroxy-2-butanone-4-phosphate synthase/GTP cyclohydrolase II [bacterium]|nr:bifunctional 3,4-dihydroxy-2-butanone-4-phosphate synthase/GTP cyclohydrolase II [bacterium]MCP5462408.1 bifunctional 3,4-dihydroxy-2-butanone-4-phosphate synthase/GTP cyclohydrolase II [bacterium]
MSFDTVEEVLEDIRNGKMVIVTDDDSRENEGDLIAAASLITPEGINFMITHARGLVCVPMIAERLEDLGLKPMVPKYISTTKDTAFSVSVDAREEISTGISAHDRARTIQLLVDPSASSKDFVMPGHIFPLRATEGGVLRRAGHTEAAVDLVKMAGLYPAGVICEITNPDGSMARVPELLEFKKKHNLKLCSIAQLIEYRCTHEKLISRVAVSKLPTKYGIFTLYAYYSELEKKEHLALVMGDVESEDTTIVRIHSECLTGDVLGSLRCDCGSQLHDSLHTIASHGKGVLLYMRQEGRGIGLLNKLKAYELQDKGLDTVEANNELGFKDDMRNYSISAQILKDLNIKNVMLLTNNPRKVSGLQKYGINVVDRMKITSQPTEYNKKYLEAKRDKLGHMFQVI